MDATLYIFQQYWWALVSLLGALLVFLMFVQGGQTLLFGTAENESEKVYLLNLLGHKWELTYTTLVTFGGAAFASFPLFYSTSFGGAYWLWLLILFLFVIQAVSYEFRSNKVNLLGKKTYDTFLYLNGMLGTFFIGVAVGTLYSGGAYFMDKANITDILNPTVSSWANGWMGLDAVANLFNILLGLVVVFAARTLGLLFALNSIPDEIVNVENGTMQSTDKFRKKTHKQLAVSGIVFVLLFVLFLVVLFLKTGYSVDPVSGTITAEKYKYFFNYFQLVWPLILLLVGVVAVLAGLVPAIFLPSIKLSRYSFWITGAGVVFAVWSLLICAAFNNTAYFPSLVNIQDSLTLYNSSSSMFTLKTMTYVSVLIPFVLAYIVYVWVKMRGYNPKSDY